MSAAFFDARDWVLHALGQPWGVVSVAAFFAVLGVASRLYHGRAIGDDDFVLHEMILGTSIVLQIALVVAMLDLPSLTKLLSSGVAVAELAIAMIYIVIRNTVALLRQLTR